MQKTLTNPSKISKNRQKHRKILKTLKNVEKQSIISKTEKKTTKISKNRQKI